ncbi:nicotinate-nucleotide--dimethylbenzimidazole phosphoribosyltransferase [Streptomyces sp. NPDC047002]|uniref:nicotinate-nucleotide--dimethylbenzimidazole phosphoribosyltransferase n=1 Tax=Streptomyces sp. NPDC047002 TaxID=3155475 RepID=UPI0034564FBF
MTDTGGIPGEGRPGNAGMVEQQGGQAAGEYTYLDPSDAPQDDDDLLLMPSAQGAWSDPQPVPSQEHAYHAPPVDQQQPHGGHHGPGQYAVPAAVQDPQGTHTPPIDQPAPVTEPAAQTPVHAAPQAQYAPPQQHTPAHGVPYGAAQVTPPPPQEPTHSSDGRGFAAPQQPPATPDALLADETPGHGDGTQAEDLALNGQAVPGQAYNGQADPGRPADGQSLDGRQVAGESFEGFEGQDPDGPQAPGQSLDGRQFDGQEAGGPVLDGRESPGQEPGGQVGQGSGGDVDGAAVQEAPGEPGVDPQAPAAPEGPGTVGRIPAPAAPADGSLGGQAAAAPAQAAPRRPLRLGPPVSDPPSGVVRSLADRGPAARKAPVYPVRSQTPGPPTTGPEYFDVAHDAPAAESGAAAPGTAGAPQGGVPWVPQPPQAPQPQDAGAAEIQAVEPQTPEPQVSAAEPVPEQEAGPQGRAADAQSEDEQQEMAQTVEEQAPQDSVPAEETPEAVDAAVTEDAATAEAAPEAAAVGGPEAAPEAVDAVAPEAAPGAVASMATEDAPEVPAAEPAEPAKEPEADAPADVPQDAEPAEAPGAPAAPVADEPAADAPPPVLVTDAGDAAGNPGGGAADPGTEPAPAGAAAAEAPVPEATAEPGPAEPGADPGPAPSGYDDAERDTVLRVMRERRDIRNGFRSDPVPQDVLLRVLEAAHTAPSVGHSQPWDFVVIRSEETRRAMHELAQRQRDAYAESLPKGRAKQFKELKIEAILDTPVNIVVTADPTRGGRHTLGRHTQPQMAPYSSALAVENLWLAARAEGLGVGWVSFFDEREMVRALGLPEHLEVVAYLCVGYVDTFPEDPELMQAGWSKRRPLAWVVHEETYGRRILPGAEPHDLLQETVAGIRPLDAKALGEAWERQKRMTKPAGALGVLEIISAQLSGLSRMSPPPIPEPAALAVFAGDHGVHAQGVTPWPQEVTGQMVANFLGGGAVCNAFAGQVGAEICVVDVGVASELPATSGLLPRKVRPGTADFTTGPAMTREEAVAAIEAGIETARDLVTAGNKALLTGEMGIANTTVSAALISVFTGMDPAEVTGRGTGINDETHSRKVDVVRRALDLHRPDPADPIGVLAAVGGLEHAALVGFLLGGASLRTPVILDGVSAGAAALVARAIAPESLAACIAGHRSAEPGHVAALTKLGLRPLVDLDLRLGEGTGALLALPLVQSAARAMHEVATFDSAGVTEK